MEKYARQEQIKRDLDEQVRLKAERKRREAREALEFDRMYEVDAPQNGRESPDFGNTRPSAFDSRHEHDFNQTRNSYYDDYNTDARNSTYGSRFETSGRFSAPTSPLGASGGQYGDQGQLYTKASRPMPPRTFEELSKFEEKRHKQLEQAQLLALQIKEKQQRKAMEKALLQEQERNEEQRIANDMIDTRRKNEGVGKSVTDSKSGGMDSKVASPMSRPNQNRKQMSQYEDMGQPDTSYIALGGTGDISQLFNGGGQQPVSPAPRANRFEMSGNHTTMMNNNTQLATLAQNEENPISNAHRLAKFRREIMDEHDELRRLVWRQEQAIRELRSEVINMKRDQERDRHNGAIREIALASRFESRMPVAQSYGGGGQQQLLSDSDGGLESKSMFISADAIQDSLDSLLGIPTVPDKFNGMEGKYSLVATEPITSRPWRIESTSPAKVSSFEDNRSVQELDMLLTKFVEGS